MSKNITIQEGGVGRQFTADKLKTALVGGGSCTWVPEDEVRLKTLSVTENGTYSAEDEGEYGYSQVHVNVPGGAGGAAGGIGSSLVGKDPDGNDMLVSVDENGNLVESVLPESIRVITPPDNPYGIYVDGQTIGKTGMSVMAYRKDGTEWGRVSNDAVTLDPETAIYAPGEGMIISLDDTSILKYPHNDPITVCDVYGTFDCPSPGSVNGYRFKVEGSGIIYVVYVDIETRHDMVFLSKDSFGLSRGWGDLSKAWEPETYRDAVKASDEYAGEYYVRSQGTSNEVPPFPGNRFEVPWYYSETDFARQLWANGDRPAGYIRRIAVTWPRPGDGKVLESSFEILVAPPINIDDPSSPTGNPELNS